MNEEEFAEMTKRVVGKRARIDQTVASINTLLEERVFSTDRVDAPERVDKHGWTSGMKLTLNPASPSEFNVVREMLALSMEALINDTAASLMLLLAKSEGEEDELDVGMFVHADVKIKVALRSTEDLEGCEGVL